MIKKMIIANLISYGILAALTIAASPLLVKLSVDETFKIINNMENED